MARGAPGWQADAARAYRTLNAVPHSTAAASAEKDKFVELFYDRHIAQVGERAEGLAGGQPCGAAAARGRAGLQGRAAPWQRSTCIPASWGCALKQS